VIDTTIAVTLAAHNTPPAVWVQVRLIPILETETSADICPPQHALWSSALTIQ